MGVGGLQRASLANSVTPMTNIYRTFHEFGAMLGHNSDQV